MMKHKKNKYWTLLFSLMPGAAEMYMGFMKNGFSIMAVFFASFIIPSVLRVRDVFLLLAVMVWFYGFFHARNLAACSEEELQEIPDDYIWSSFGKIEKIEISNPTLKKWGAVILIFYGLSLLWQSVSQLFYSIVPEYMRIYLYPVMEEVPQIAAAFIIIAIGIKLIIGKKEALNGTGE